MHLLLSSLLIILFSVLSSEVGGHAQSKSHISGKQLLAIKDDIDFRPYDDEGEQRPAKRGWAWLSYVFKAIKISGQVASTTSALANIANTIFRAIAGCCVDFPDACKSRDAFLEMKAKIVEKSKKIDDMQLEAQNIQVWTNYSVNAYEDIVRELIEISDEQEKYIQSYSKNVNMAMKNATIDIQEILKANLTSNPDKVVEFIDVTKMFESFLDKSLSATAPAIGLLIPFGGKIYKYAKHVIAAKGAGMVESALAVVLKTTVSLKTKQTESKLSRFISETNRRMAIEAVKIKNHLNKRFGSAIKIASAMGKGLSVSMSYLNAAMNIYMIISSREACRKRQEQVQQAEKELNQSMQHLDEAETKIKEAKQVLHKSFEYLRSNITNQNLKALLANIKHMIEEISSPSQELEEVAIGIDTFLNNINSETSYSGTYKLEQTLLKALAQVPSTLRCYSNKVRMANHVFTSCKKGQATFDVIYKEARELFDVDSGFQRDNPQTCMGKLGFSHINKEDLIKAWTTIADKEEFNKNCLLNNQQVKERSCDLVRDGYTHAQIAAKLSLTEEEAAYLVKNCPKSDELTPFQKQAICNFKKLNLLDEKIAESLMIDLSIVKNVNCN